MTDNNNNNNNNDYHKALQAIDQKKKKNGALLALDRFLHEELPETIKLRSPKHLTWNELSDIMEWKLTRGKMRPLQKLVRSNNADVVEAVTARAFKQLEQLDQVESSESLEEEPLNTLIELKGIGVATASAILSLFCPTKYPFMSDELMQTMLHRVDYTLPTYRALIMEMKRVYGNEVCLEQIGRELWTKEIFRLYNLDVTETANDVAAEANPTNQVTAQSKKRRRK